MMLWFIIATMAVASLALLAGPLFARRPEKPSLDEMDYLAAQLDDVERERDIGALSGPEAQTARLEAKRRLLAAARARPDAGDSGNTGVLRPLAILAVGAIPLAALGLYLAIGAPDRAGSQSAGAAASSEDPSTQIAAVVADLERRVADNPRDADSLVRLAEAYGATGRYSDAVSALRKATALDPTSAFLHAALAEVLILQNGGAASAESQAAIDRALSLDPTEPRARFYRSISAWQAGERESALADMASLVNEAPDTAPWLSVAHNELAAMAMELGRTLEQAGLSKSAQTRLERQLAAESARARPAPPAAGRGPAAGQVAAAEAMTPEEQKEMIAGMVSGLAARLEANPDDAEGWMMLGRSYGVLGELDKSVEAFARAVALSPNDGGAQLSYARARLARSEASGAPVDRETEQALASVLQTDANQTFALYYLGLAAQQRNDAESAQRHWRRLHALLPPESEDAKRIAELLSVLE